MYGRQSYQILLLFVFILLCLVFAFLSDAFFTWQNAINILTSSATIGILAVGAALVIGGGGLDLSIGSVMGLCAVTSVALFPLSSPVIVFFCILCGIFAGMINGWLIGAFGLPTFIVTLGMLSSARGLALLVSEGRAFYGLPDSIIYIGQGSFGGVPIPVYIFAAVVVAGHVLLRQTAFGIHNLAIGDNEESAKSAGINIVRHKIILYVFSGFLASVAALIFMGRVNAADPNAGAMYEFNAITAAIIGGTALSGGKTSVIGAVLGAIILGVLQNGLTLMNISAYYHQMLIGIVLVGAVLFAGQERTNASSD